MLGIGWDFIIDHRKKSDWPNRSIIDYNRKNLFVRIPSIIRHVCFMGKHVNEAMLREDPGNEVEFHFEPILRDASFLAVQLSYICNIFDRMKQFWKMAFTAIWQLTILVLHWFITLKRWVFYNTHNQMWTKQNPYKPIERVKHGHCTVF